MTQDTKLSDERTALLYEHDDGRYAVAMLPEHATFAQGVPAWHRVGPVAVYGQGPEAIAHLSTETVDNPVERVGDAIDAPAAAAARMIGWWDSTQASGFRWKDGIVRSDLPDGSPIYATAAQATAAHAGARESLEIENARIQDYAEQNMLTLEEAEDELRTAAPAASALAITGELVQAASASMSLREAVLAHKICGVATHRPPKPAGEPKQARSRQR